MLISPVDFDGCSLGLEGIAETFEENDIFIAERVAANDDISDERIETIVANLRLRARGECGRLNAWNRLVDLLSELHLQL